MAVDTQDQEHTPRHRGTASRQPFFVSCEADNSSGGKLIRSFFLLLSGKVQKKAERVQINMVACI